MKMLNALKLPLISITIGLLVGAILMALSGFDPFSAMTGLVTGGFGSTYALTTTLTRATPIIFAGLAGALAWGSGYSSLGAAGQMVLGALTSAIVAVHCPGPDWFIVVMAILSGMIAGMLYSLISIYLTHQFQLYLLIVTLMLNYLADYIASYVASYVVKDPNGLDSSAVQTQLIEGSVLPQLLDGYTLHAGFIIAIVVTILIYVIMKYTTFGYKAKMGGLNATFATYGGIKSSKMMYQVLLLSGAIAGLGGAIEVLGTRYRFVDMMITSPGYAWSGIIASLMSANHPIGIFISAIFLAGMTTGGSSIERNFGVPSEVTIIIQGIITLLITARFVVKFNAKQAKKEAN